MRSPHIPAESRTAYSVQRTAYREEMLNAERRTLNGFSGVPAFRPSGLPASGGRKEGGR